MRVAVVVVYGMMVAMEGAWCVVREVTAKEFVVAVGVIFAVESIIWADMKPPTPTLGPCYPGPLLSLPQVQQRYYQPREYYSRADYPLWHSILHSMARLPVIECAKLGTKLGSSRSCSYVAVKENYTAGGSLSLNLSSVTPNFHVKFQL